MAKLPSRHKSEFMSGRAKIHGVIRIVLVDVPKLMADVLNDAIKKDRGMAIIDRVSARKLADRPGDFDVVMTALKEGEHDVSPSLQRLLFHFPHASVIAFSGRGHRMEIFDRNVVREIAPGQIPKIVRQSKARST